MNSQDEAAGSIGPEPSDAAAEPARVPAGSRPRAPWAGEIGLPAGPGAPGAGRTALSRWLQGHAPSGVIDDAQLVVTELITNSLEHAGVSPDDELGLRIELGHGWVRIEVEDPGDGGLIAPRGPDLLNGGGFGLNIVMALAAQWGAVREGSTRVWAELTWPTDALLGAA